MRLVLQSRWKVVPNGLEYYGLRAVPHTLRRFERVDRKTLESVRALDGARELQPKELTRGMKRLVKKKIVVESSACREPPESFAQARFCKQCCANDYMIPGLELNGQGLCPFCETAERFSFARNVLPVKNKLSRSQSGAYDVAVFYTGGKDSSFLLYYMSRVLRLRVLSLTWKMPFLSENALKSIENARKRLPEVTFVVREAPPSELQKIYRRAYELQGNVCICPSVAYVLFYPLLVEYGVPYLVLGNEPSQCKNLIYNRMAPPVCYRPWAQRALRILAGCGRLTTLRRPYREGQFELRLTVKNLAFGQSRLFRYVKYKNPLVENTCAALRAAPDFLKPFQEAVRNSGRKGKPPALIHMDFDAISRDGVYRWGDVKELLQKELGWVDATAQNKGLHTSCKLERCKEYTQLLRFREMQANLIPFSAVEMPLAVLEGCISREAAVEELKRHSGFSQEAPAEMQLMYDFLTSKDAGISASSNAGRDRAQG